MYGQGRLQRTGKVDPAVGLPQTQPFIGLTVLSWEGFAARWTLMPDFAGIHNALRGYLIKAHGTMMHGFSGYRPAPLWRVEGRQAQRI